MRKKSNPKDKRQFFGLSLLFVIFLAGCGLQGSLRVAIDGDPGETLLQTPVITTTPSAVSTSTTPEPRIAGNFTVAPIIISTLPAFAPPIEAPVLQKGTPIDGEELLSELSIEALASRAYGQDAGTLTIESVLESPGGFARAMISYPSDSLKIFGFMNIPAGEGPFPVVIFIHGWVASYQYETLDYSVRYADDLARRGFIVIHPNLRGYPPSDSGPDYFEIGKAIDVLNLVAIVQRDAGKTGLLLQADPDAIAVWGHSTGGGIAIRVVTVNMPSLTGAGPAVKAAILYAPMSGDEFKNAYRTFYVFSGQTRLSYEITVPPEDLLPISPVYFYDRIEAAIQIHHGELDSLVPVDWSRETCAQMLEAGVTVECYDYRTQTHNFCCESYKWMLDRMVSFMEISPP